MNESLWVAINSEISLHEENCKKEYKMNELIQKQEEFCKWLKRHNLYDPSDSIHTMNKMQAVWNVYRENLKDLYENKYEPDKLVILIESMHKGKW